MSVSDYKIDYDRDGFVIVRDFLPAADFAEVNGNLDRYVNHVVPNLPDADAFFQDKSRLETLKQMQNMSDNDPFFADYRQHERWSALAGLLIGEPAEEQEPEWFNNPPNTVHPTPPHQDNYYFNLKPHYACTLWLALDPVDEENGCLRYAVGSHIRGIRPHGSTSVLVFPKGSPTTDQTTRRQRR